MFYFVYYSSTVLPDGLSELSIKSVWKSLGFIITQSLPPELLTLPVMYGRKEIPGDYTQIGTTETAKQYNHLRDIQDKLHQLQNCTFGLLIGCNCATALAPINTITSAMPYAQESVLGWCIVGNAVPSDKYTGRTLKTLVQHDSSIQKPHILKKNHFAQLAKIL